MNSDGSDVTNLSKTAASHWLRDISPLGSKIIFEEESHTYTMSLDGTNKKLITDKFYQRFSPDETKIAYYDNGKLCVENSDGTYYCLTEINLPYDLDRWWDQLFHFLPDGGKIAYSNNDSIYIIDLNGSSHKSLACGDRPQFVPDGSKIVFYDSPAISIMNSDGTSITKITDVIGPLFRYIISPDGLNIVYTVKIIKSDSSKFDLGIIGIDGNNHKILTNTINPYYSLYYELPQFIKFSPMEAK